ncbi:hypothetical protein B0H21DRAFT_750862 [Amylocystis lapponica]|nr:hypothetical protein B0H21DRAFT_750862 [Amylocystis lapponica]
MSAAIPRPPRERPPSETRDSVLRASILESALELGVGSSRTVAHWIFNPVQEGDEDAESEDVVSPSLTYASTATSDESFPPNYASRAQPGAGIHHSEQTSGKMPSPDSSTGLGPTYQYSPREGLRAGAASPEVPHHIQFNTDTRAVSPLPWKNNKLRKARPNGYESDGYMSDGGKVKKEKEKKSKKKEKDRAKDGAATDHESDGGYLSEASVKKKKNKRAKEKKDKGKDADSPTADYDTDGHTSKTSSPRSSKDRRSRKMSHTGDESDGGYISEASGRTRRFFRLNSRTSRKRQDSDSATSPTVPPVPALPAVLPIAVRFLRSPSPPNSLDSRTVTPVPGQYASSTERGSSETYTSFSTFSPPHDDSASSLISQEGLVRAFRDVESVRRPSIDALSTFHHLGSPPTSARTSPLPQSHPYGRSYNASPEPPQETPAISVPKNKSARPTISAPNTSMLSPKHVPVPLVLSGNNSIRSQTGHIVPSPEPDSAYVLVTPTAGATNAPSPSGIQPSSDYLVPSPGQPGSPGPRSHVLAFYDLPPPTPPPRGPLPEVPSPTTPRFSESPEARFPPRALTPQGRPNTVGMERARSPTLQLQQRPGTAPVTRSASDTAKPPASPQRGRVSPFPVSPVLARRPSVIMPPLRVPDAPLSADAYHPHPHDNLGAHWQPRSASVLERRPGHVRFADEEPESDTDDAPSARSAYQSVDDDASFYPDEAEGGRRSRFYADGGDGDGDRSSVWSASEGRLSFMDGEKSAAARERFVRGVEEMYGPEVIPPVPQLRPTVRTG